MCGGGGGVYGTVIVVKFLSMIASLLLVNLEIKGRSSVVIFALRLVARGHAVFGGGGNFIF